MATSTLAQIRKKVRRLTASPDEAQLTTAELDEYIDTVYEQDFPSQLKVWQLKDTYSFVTTPNVDKYLFPINTYHTADVPVYCDGYQIEYSQSREMFYGQWPFANFQSTINTGDGLVAGPYTFTLTQIPVLPNNVTISTTNNAGNQMVVEDNGSGVLVDFGGTTVRGQINYVTGVGTVTFSAIVPDGAQIIARTVPYVASRPMSILYFQNYFILRPVPDKVYRVVVTVYRTPSQFIDLTAPDAAAVPQLNRWWQFLAFGAAIKVLQDRMDTDTIAQVLPFYEEQRSLIVYNTAAQNHNQRAPSIYMGNGLGGVSGSFWGANGV